jgi:hypothetical protein
MRPSPTRRALVGTLATLGAAGLAGCNALFDGGGESGTESGDGGETADGPTGETGAQTTGGTPEAAALEQTVSVGNPNATAGYVTVAVESPGGETVFVESLELSPGERRPTTARLPGSGTYRVVAEAVDGRRGTFEWVADDRLDGFSLTLVAEGFEFWRTAVCRGACRLASGGDDAPPLIGNGVGRWYAPASLVLQNAESSARTARVDVELDGRTVLAATYETPPRTRVEVPVTYRTGEYRVRVGVGGETLRRPWSVPGQPSLFVDLGERTTGCGLANSELVLLNADDEPHAVSVVVESDDEELFAERWKLDPDERVSVVPVDASGRYGLRVRVDAGDPFYAVWWSCPPRGPATVVVDATGGASVSQSRL